MAITIDTHALIWYIDKNLNDKLSPKAMHTIVEAEKNDLIYVPIIVLMEILYLAEKGKLNLSFGDLLSQIENSINYEIIPFGMEVLKIAESLTGLEAHDRLILATAQLTGTSLVSKDRALRKNSVKVVW